MDKQLLDWGIFTQIGLQALKRPIIPTVKEPLVSRKVIDQKDARHSSLIGSAQEQCAEYTTSKPR